MDLYLEAWLMLEQRVMLPYNVDVILRKQYTLTGVTVALRSIMINSSQKQRYFNIMYYKTISIYKYS